MPWTPSSLMSERLEFVRAVLWMMMTKSWIVK